jgi:probable HAF family extracellular repeat protein
MKFPRKSWMFAVVGMLCAAGFAAFAATQYKFSLAGNYPGAFQTTPLAVHGKYIVGYYQSGNHVNGYLQWGTIFQNVYPPGSKSSYISAMNRYQDVVGGSCPNGCNPNTGQHGFLYSQGVYTQIDYPSGEQGTTTTAFGINDKGQIVGGYCLPPQSSCPGATIDPANHAFLDDNGVFTQLDYPKAQLTEANAINDGGTIVGTYTAKNYLHSYFYQNGVYTNIDVPGQNWTFVSTINNHGVAAGFYQDKNLNVHGFLYEHGRFTTIDRPGATATSITGFDDAGVIVGIWANGSDEGNFKGVPVLPSP